jgi:hypothetical protein
MWEKLQQLFRRQPSALPSAKPEEVQASAEPTSVGVGLERERRDFTALAKEFEYLFAYRPDLIPLVTEVKAGQDVSHVRTILQGAVSAQRDTLRELLESLKPQVLQFSEAPELQENFETLLGVLQHALPSKASVENFHHLYHLELSGLLVEHPPATEETPLAPERAALETLASEMVVFETSGTKPTPFEQTLTAQGDMLAELNVFMARFQGNTESEYQDFVTALAGLKTAHDTHHVVPELVLKARESYRRFESVRQQHAHSLHDEQKRRIQGYLTALGALPVLPTLQNNVASTKRVLEDYLAQLEKAPLEKHTLQSAGALFDDFKKQLDSGYRSELMTLVARAAKLNATSLLVDLQHAGQMLEGGQYPNLETLSRALSQTTAQDKHRKTSHQRAHKFQHDLREAQGAFTPLAKLNNDEVETVRQSLAYLESQREYFQTASAVVQSELQKTLVKTKVKLKKLAKQLEATRAVAEELRTSDILEHLFADASDTDNQSGVLESTNRTHLQNANGQFDK